MTFSISAVKRVPKNAEILRAAHQVPAVLYGPDIPSTPIAIRYRDFERLYQRAGESTLVDVTLEGESAPVKALIVEVQFDPVKGRILHADFRQIDLQQEMEVDIDLSFTGESAAVKGLGGTLIKALDKIRVKCLPKDLVGHIVVDISVLQTFDNLIHVKDISYLPGITPVDDGGMVVAKVAAPLTEEQIKAMEETAAPADLSKIEVEEKGKKEEEGEEGAAEEGGAEKAESKAEKKEEKK